MPERVKNTNVTSARILYSALARISMRHEIARETNAFEGFSYQDACMVPMAALELHDVQKS